MKGRIETSYGEVLIDENVISEYAGSRAIECFGVVGMAAVSMKDGIVKLLKKENLSRGVKIYFHDDGIVINFHIIVAYGVSISAVSDNLTQNVKYYVEQFTGMKVKAINILVESVRVID